MWFPYVSQLVKSAAAATDEDGNVNAKKPRKTTAQKPKKPRPKKPRIQLPVRPVWDKPGRPWTTIGLPSPPNPSLYTKTNNYGDGLKPRINPDCRLKDPTECCDDIWHPHWWAIYVSLQEMWPWYLEQEANSPGKWSNVPQELPNLTYAQFVVPMKAVDVEIHPRGPRVPWPDRITFTCFITLDENDVLYDRAVALRPAIRLRGTRSYMIHCRWTEMAMAEPHNFWSPQNWMEPRTSRIHVGSELHHYCKPIQDQEPTVDDAMEMTLDEAKRQIRRARSRSAVEIKGPRKKSCITLDNEAIQMGSMISAYISKPILEDGNFNAASNFVHSQLQSELALDPAYGEVYDQVVGQVFGSNTFPSWEAQQPDARETAGELERERLQQADQYTQLIDTQWMDEALELFGMSSASLTTTIPVAEHSEVRLPYSFTTADVGPAQSLQHIVTSTEWEVLKANPDSKVQSCAHTLASDFDWDYLWPAGTAAQFQTAIFDPPFLLDGGN